ncbi:MAG: hypothetical protein IJS43_07390 [Bacteroidaceae bacterium]|nr:hypothetical protein [Bacteroidaceae bacterium]
MSKIETYREATGDAKYLNFKTFTAMTTLLNNSDFQMMAQAQPVSNQISANKMSKISHPLAQGSTMYLKAQRALAKAKKEIIGFYGQFVCILTENAYNDGTAQIVLERYEDGESVRYQCDIDIDGTYIDYQI